MSEQHDTRRSFLKSSLAATLATAVPASAQKPAKPSESTKRPNIILYLADQFRWDFVGANGRNGTVRTPNIDALAANGKNFTQAITNQPVCAPARSVIFTSRYATETGVWRNGLALDHSLPTLACELKKAGYSANLIGKWHLASNDKRSRRGAGCGQSGGSWRLPRSLGGSKLDREYLAPVRRHYLGSRQ